MELVRKYAYSVNPLTWSATGPGGVGAAAPANYQNFFAPYDTLPGGYHGYDYSFFFRNVEKNVIERVAA